MTMAEPDANRDDANHDEDPRESELGAEMTFVEHLVELRDRLLRSVLTVVVATAVLFPFDDQLYTWLARPLMKHLPAGATMIATEVASPFLTPFKLTLVVAVLVSMPVLLYQIWAFVAPGLYRHERKLIYPLVLLSTVMFYTGMLFAYFVVFPLIFAFFTSVAPHGVRVMTDITAYLNFVLKILFAFGVAFQVPVATILLVWTGFTTPAGLSAKRPYIIVGAFVVGMLLTPPDVVSQTMLALPLWGLFELGLLMSRMYVRKPDPEETAAPDGGDSGPLTK